MVTNTEDKRKPLILIGGGGHGKSCIDVIEATGMYRIAGILDRPEKVGLRVLGYPILGTRQDIAGLVEKGYAFCVAIGQIDSCYVRKSFYEELTARGAELPVIRSPSAYVSEHAMIGAGTLVMHSAIVNAGAIIGENCIINTGVLVEHDVRVSDHVHIATRAVVNGGCEIGEGVLVGSGSILRQGIAITSRTTIGAGSNVVNSISEPGVYVGNPAKRIQ